MPSDAATQLSIDGVTEPSPVHAMIKACPALSEMGAVVNTPMAAPAGAARSPVVLSYAKAWPSPFAVVVKMPGDAGTTLTLCGADVPLPRVTTIFTVPLQRNVGSTECQRSA